MLVLLNLIIFIWTLWFWNGVPGLEWMFPALAGFGVVYSIWLGYYSRFRARRKQFHNR